MVQIIHHYHGCYPFGLQREADELTFMELIRSNLSPQEIEDCRRRAKIYRDLPEILFIRLLKILKEDNDMHLLYEYHQISLVLHLQSLPKQLPPPHHRATFTSFYQQLEAIVQVLIHAEIKMELQLSSFACAPSLLEEGAIQIKAFIPPEAEYLSLAEHCYRPKVLRRKDRSGANQDFLGEFYEFQKKRVVTEFEDFMESLFGKFPEAVEKKLTPNFVISGTKLVFLPPMPSVDLTSSGKGKKMEQIPIPKPDINTQTSPFKPKQEEVKESQQEQARRRFHEREGKTVSRQHLMRAELKSQQPTKENTDILQDNNDYLTGLQQELNTIYDKRAEQPKKAAVSEQPPKQIDLTSSEKTKKDVEIKAEKIGKYKMKIITSHEIEIEGSENMDIGEKEREIIEGLRSGKLNINDLTQSNSKESKEGIEVRDMKKDGKESKMVDSVKNEKEKEKEKEGDSEERISELQQQAKIKSINDIIQKIGIKYGDKSNKLAQQKKEEKKQATKQVHKQVNKQVKMEQKKEQKKEEEKSDNYVNKIREAKIKAEQVLREYTKKKP